MQNRQMILLSCSDDEGTSCSLFELHSFSKNIARIAKAALHNLPGKSSLNLYMGIEKIYIYIYFPILQMRGLGHSMTIVTPPHPGHRTPGRKGETSLHDNDYDGSDEGSGGESEL